MVRSARSSSDVHLMVTMHMFVRRWLCWGCFLLCIFNAMAVHRHRTVRRGVGLAKDVPL